MLRFVAILLILLVQFAAWARPADAPQGATALCGDGTYSTSLDKRGACRGHKGIKEWYGLDTTPEQPVGEAQVWVNLATKVYHCSGDPNYGKTKTGRFLSEEDAKRLRYHPNQQKPCSSQ